MTAVTAVTGPLVVKLGGSILEDDAVRGAALDALAAVHLAGRPVAVVHGGGKRIDGWLSRLDIPRRIHEGLRVTDAPTREVVVAVLAGIVSKGLVAELAARGVRAVGLSGADGGVLTATRRGAVDGIDLGWVGTAPEARRDLLDGLTSAGLLPLVASIALGPDAQLLNVNADAAAAAVAGSWGARRLLFLTDVEAVRDDRGHDVAELDAGEMRALLASGTASGGMRPKLEACLRALDLGVPEVAIAGPRRHAAAVIGGSAGTVVRHAAGIVASAAAASTVAAHPRAGRVPRTHSS